MMARTKDREIVSEAVRLHDVWRIDQLGNAYNGAYVVLVTDCDERLYILYGTVGQIKTAIYTHYDERGVTVSEETITANKRKRVLHLIEVKREN